METETLITELMPDKIKKPIKVVEPQVIEERKIVKQSRADKFLNNFKALKYVWENK